MNAKQLMVAATLVVLVGSVRAQPAPPSAQPDDEASSAPGTVTPVVEPSPTRRARTGTFSIGAGYNTDDGFGAAADITQSDLFGTGTLLSLDAKLDERRQRAELRYSDPELAGTSFQLDATLYSQRDQYNGFARDGVGTQLMLSHLIAPHVKAFAGYRFEHVNLQPDGPVPPLDITSATYNLATLRAGVEYNTLDQPFLATRGSRVGTYLEVAAPELGSDVTLVHTKAYAETHHALGPMILHVGGSFETVTGYGGLPEGELLHFDGSTQLRGFAPNAFGPRDDAGRVVGGTMAAYGHADLELPLSRHYGISAVGFVDGGGLFDAHAGELGASTGVGFLWRSPIGPIGAYWAWPSLSGPPKFIFGVGTAF